MKRWLLIVLILLSVIIGVYILKNHSNIKKKINIIPNVKPKKQEALPNITETFKLKSFNKTMDLEVPVYLTSNNIIKISKENPMINSLVADYLINNLQIIRSTGSVVVPGDLIYPTNSIFRSYVQLKNANLNIIITQDFLDYIFLYSRSEIFLYLVEKYLYNLLYRLIYNDFEELYKMYRNNPIFFKYLFNPMVYLGVALRLLDNKTNIPENILNTVNNYIYLIKKGYGCYLLPRMNKFCFYGFSLIETKYGLRIDGVRNASLARLCLNGEPFMNYDYYKDFLNNSKYNRFILVLLWLGNARLFLKTKYQIKSALLWLYSLEECKINNTSCLVLWYRLWKILNLLFFKQDYASFMNLYNIIKLRLNNIMNLNVWLSNYGYFTINKSFSFLSIKEPYPFLTIYNKLTGVDGRKFLLYLNGKLKLCDILNSTKILPNELDVINNMASINSNNFVKIVKSNYLDYNYYPNILSNNYMNNKRLISTMGFLSLLESMDFLSSIGKKSEFVVLKNNIYVLVLPYFSLMSLFVQYFINLRKTLIKLGINDLKLEDYLNKIIILYLTLLNDSKIEFYRGIFVKNISILNIYNTVTSLTGKSINIDSVLSKSLEYNNINSYYYTGLSGLNYLVMILKINGKYVPFIGPIFNYYEFYSSRIISRKYWNDYLSKNIERPEIYYLLGLSHTNGYVCLNY